MRHGCTSVADLIDDTLVRRLASPSDLRAGREIAATGGVDLVKRGPLRVIARVTGTRQTHTVELISTPSGLEWSCTLRRHEGAFVLQALRGRRSGEPLAVAGSPDSVMRPPARASAYRGFVAASSATTPASDTLRGPLRLLGPRRPLPPQSDAMAESCRHSAAGPSR